MFGKKNSGTTVAVVDVGSGSVAAALVRTRPGEAPRLFAQTRIALPLLHTRDTQTLSRETEKALERALAHVSEVASRVRAHDTLGSHGDIARVDGFFSVPWAALSPGGVAEVLPHMADTVGSITRSLLGERPLSFNAFGSAALHGSMALFPDETPAIVCIVGGETTELLVLDAGRLAARATLPLGLHTLVRTLMSHGGMSSAEAFSYIALAAVPRTAAVEPVEYARAHFVEEFMSVARRLIKAAPIQSVLVLAPQPAEEWFARTLGDAQALAEAFPQGGTVRALKPSYVRPYLAGHGARLDLPLMLEALFVDKNFTR